MKNHAKIKNKIQASKVKMKIWQKVMEKSLNFELSQMSHLFREACVDDNLHTLLTHNDTDSQRSCERFVQVKSKKLVVGVLYRIERIAVVVGAVQVVQFYTTILLFSSKIQNKKGM